MNIATNVELTRETSLIPRITRRFVAFRSKSAAHYFVVQVSNDGEVRKNELVRQGYWLWDPTLSP
jgi:hypothetical protein